MDEANFLTQFTLGSVDVKYKVCETRSQILNFETPCLTWKGLGTGRPGNTWRRESASTIPTPPPKESTAQAEQIVVAP